MKRFLLASAAAVLLLASCSKTEIENPGKEMTFQAFSTKPKAKALITNGKYPENETFGVYAYYLADQKNWEANSADSVRYFHEEIKCQKSRTPKVWAADNKYYWPAVGSVTFFAYSPYSVKAKYAGNNGIILSGYTVSKDEDFMVSNPAKDKTTNDQTINTGVDIVFGHKLALVDFKIKTKEDYTADGWTIKVKEIKLDSIYSKGDYKEFDGTNSDVWSNQTDQISYTFQADDYATGGQVATNTATDYESSWRGDSEDALLALPQVLNVTPNYTAKLTVTYTLTQVMGTTTVYENVEKTKTVVLSTTDISEWKVNKKYIYTIIIGLDEILFDPSVDNWEDPEEEDLEL